ncbi:MAG: hypothetical protein EHM57_07225 [Actinobacteria bacterium]|nr:MAG: hypothetical protein EHM57_07225 [Actinomycetota bacterium]
MNPTPRMRRALHQVEARRIQLERAIVDDLEERFFADPEPAMRDAMTHLGLAAANRSEGTTTACQFSVVWLA